MEKHLPSIIKLQNKVRTFLTNKKSPTNQKITQNYKEINFSLKTFPFYDHFDIIFSTIPSKQVSIVSVHSFELLIKPLVFPDSFSSEQVVQKFSTRNQNVPNVSTFISNTFDQMKMPLTTKTFSDIIENSIIIAEFKVLIEPSYFLRLRTSYKPVVEIKILVSKDKTRENKLEQEKNFSISEGKQLNLNKLLLQDTIPNTLRKRFSIQTLEKEEFFESHPMIFNKPSGLSDKKHLPKLRTEKKRADSSHSLKKSEKYSQFLSSNPEKIFSNTKKQQKNLDLLSLPEQTTLNSNNLSKTSTLPLIPTTKTHLKLENVKIPVSEKVKIVKKSKKASELKKTSTEPCLNSGLISGNSKEVINKDEKQCLIVFQQEEIPQQAEKSYNFQVFGKQFKKNLKSKEKTEDKDKCVGLSQGLINETSKRMIQKFFNASFTSHDEKSFKNKFKRSKIKSMIKLKIFKNSEN